MIKEVIYFQAQCDKCGQVDDAGEYSSWADADQARMSACDSGWSEIEVSCPSSFDGHNIYTVKRDGQAEYREMSVLLCENCQGDGVSWCEACEDDLDELDWALLTDGSGIVQTCPNRHMNRVPLAGKEKNDAEH